MTFLFNFLNAKGGGRLTYLRNLMPVLQREFSEDSYWLLVTQAVADTLQPADNVRVIGGGLAGRSLAYRAVTERTRVRRLVRDTGADVYVATGNYAAFQLQCRQVLYLRNALLFDDSTNTSSLRRAERRLRRAHAIRSARLADVVICPSETLARRVKDVIGPGLAEHVHAVPHGFDSARFCAAELLNDSTRERLGRLRPGSIRVLFVSLPGRHKNFPTLIRATRIVEANLGRPVDLLLTVEEGDLPPDLRGDDVVCLGSLPYEQIHLLHRQSHVFAFPSLVESFGHPLLEAMGAGTPVVASDTPISREVCGAAALYADPLDPNSFADRITALARDENLATRNAEVGRAIAARFTWAAHWRTVRALAVGTAADGADRDATALEQATPDDLD